MWRRVPWVERLWQRRRRSPRERWGILGGACRRALREGPNRSWGPSGGPGGQNDLKALRALLCVLHRRFSCGSSGVAPAEAPLREKRCGEKQKRVRSRPHQVVRVWAGVSVLCQLRTGGSGKEGVVLAEALWQRSCVLALLISACLMRHVGHSCCKRRTPWEKELTKTYGGCICFPKPFRQPFWATREVPLSTAPS